MKFCPPNVLAGYATEQKYHIDVTILNGIRLWAEKIFVPAAVREKFVPEKWDYDEKS